MLLRVVLCAALATTTVAARTSSEPPRRAPLARPLPDRPWKKDAAEAAEGAKLLGTLVQTHTEARVPLDAAAPGDARFDALLADHVTGTSHAIDPRLLGLLRTLAARHDGGALGAARLEIVSGYRSPKLNEEMRKKGHHVASHSQHSQGHAVDFRIVPAGAENALDPRDVEKEIRAIGWDGGVGTYPTKDDWFVHADVGPNRKWVN